MEKDSISAWAWVGKLVTVLGGGAGLVVAVMAVYSSATEPRSSLRASIEVNRFSLPPTVAAAVRDEYARASQKVLADLEEEIAAKTFPAASRFELANERLPRDPEQLERFVFISVSNEGSLAAKEVSLVLPDEFDVASFSRDGKKELLQRPSRIDLGDIGPRQTLQVRAWSTLPISFFDSGRFEDGTVLSFDKGLGVVEVIASPGGQMSYQRVARLGLWAMAGALTALVASLAAGFLGALVRRKRS